MPRDDASGVSRVSGTGLVARWQRRTSALIHKPALDREMEEEMRLHIAMEAEELTRTRGLSSEEALRQARLAFGSAARFREEGRDARGTRLLEDLASDARYAVRTLLHAPGFAISAALTLALGIGATTALFSVVHAALLAPLPFGDAAHTAVVWSGSYENSGSWMSYDEYELLTYEPHFFDRVGVYDIETKSVTGAGDPERVHAAQISQPTLSVLGVAPMLGRDFRPEEDVPGANDVALLGYSFWQRHFGGDPSAIGKRIEVAGEEKVVIGVMPANFRMPLDYDEKGVTELLTPLAASDTAEGAIPGPAVAPGGGSHGLYAVAHLAPAVTVEQANQELRRVADRLIDEGVYRGPTRFKLTAVPLRQQISGPLRPALLVLLGAVGLVLVIACANVAGLLFVRGERRRRETALRAVLGAARTRLARQFLTEGIVIALVGGALGMFIAWLGVVATRAWAPRSLGLISNVSLNGGVLVFALATTIGTVLIFALAPALAATRVSATETLKDGGRGSTTGRARLRARQMMVIGEIALAVVLMVGGGLMIRTVQRIMSIDPGFRSDGVLTMELSVPSSRYPNHGTISGFFEALRHRVDALPGVQRAAAARLVPLAAPIGDWGLKIPGYTPPPGLTTPGDWQIVTPGYFEALRLHLVAGRVFDDRDRDGSPVVFVISQRMAEKYFAGRDPVGASMRLANDSAQAGTVIGVVRDVEHNGLTAEPNPTFYAVHSQFYRSAQFTPRTMSLVVRTSGDPLALVRAVREQVHALDPEIPVTHVRTMNDIVSNSIARQRFSMLLLGAFGLLALVLSVVGIYGVVAQLVAARRQEFGVRAALGATPSALVRISLWDGMQQTGFGLAIGAVAALMLTRLMHGMLYGVSATDPVTFAMALLLTGLVAMAASYLPARRAGRADPASALSGE
ncbi:MAG TPA: ABC transporter permease [Gemmatimonadaceae bacterium]|nr:ABC transporter permease [Gemmatimonadaceae bacterium]